MKKKLIMVFSLVFMILLAACSGTVDVRLEIQGINGVTDADINLEQHTIEFSVSSEVESFDVANIVVAADVLVNAYQDGLHSLSVGRELPLVDGINVYYLVLSTSQSSENWVLYITKLTNTAKTPKFLTVKNLDQTYGLNEELSSGTLTVTYTDGSTEDVAITSDMVKGFDTTTYGQKRLTISYQGLSAVVSYVVVSDIKSIEVVEGWNYDYIIGADTVYTGGKLNVVSTDNSTIVVDITQDMISGFDTNTAGSKTMTITYEDKTTMFDYNVHAKYDSISLVNLKTEYKKGAKLVGNVEFVLGDYVFTKDINEFTTNFDSNVIGKQTLEVVVEGTVLTAEITIKENAAPEYSDFVQPVKSNLQLDDIVEALSIFQAIGETGWFYGAEFDEVYEEALVDWYGEDAQEVVEEVLRVLRECGLTKEQVKKIVDLYNNEFVEFITPYQEKMEKESCSFSELLNEADAKSLEQLQNILSEIITIIQPNQLTVFAAEVGSLGGLSNSRDTYFKHIDINAEVQYMAFDTFKLLLEAAGMNNVAELLDDIENNHYIFNIAKEDWYGIFTASYKAIENICDLDTQDVFDLIDYVKQIANEEIDFEDANLIPNVNKLGSLLEQLLIDSGLLEELVKVVENNLDSIFTYNGSYDVYVVINGIAQLVRLYGDEIISIVKDLSKEEFDYILDVIISIICESDEELTDEDIAKMIVKGAKLLEPIIKDLNENEEAQEIAVSIINFAPDAFDLPISDKLFYSLISNALTWTKLDEEKLTADQIESIVNTFGEIFENDEYLYLSTSGYSVAVAQNSSVEELLIALSNNYEVYYETDDNSTPIQLTENSVKGLDTTELGWHKVTVSQEGMNVNMYYYVFAADEEMEITYINYYSLTENLLYFDLNSSNPDKNVQYKEYINYNEEIHSDLDSILSNVYYRYVISTVGVESKVYITQADIEFVVDTKTTGLKLGYIVVGTANKDLYLPFQYYVYDSKNPEYFVDDTEVYLTPYESYYGEVRVKIDFGREYKYVNVNFDGAELGTYQIEYDGISFTFNVVEEKVLEQIKSVNYFNISVDASNPEESIKVTKRFDFDYNTLRNHSHWCSNYEDLMNRLTEIYNEPSIEFDWSEDCSVQYYVSTKYRIYDGNEVVYEGYARVDYLDPEEFNSSYLRMERKEWYYRHILLDSYDFTIEDLFDHYQFYLYYEHKNVESYYYSYEEFVKTYDVEIELFESYQYYNEYRITITDKNTGDGLSQSITVGLLSNKDVVISYNLCFERCTFYNLPTLEQVQAEIESCVYLWVETLSGNKHIYGEEALAYLQSINPQYKMEVFEDWIDIIIITDQGEYRTEAQFYQLDENTTINYDRYREICVFELDEEVILESARNSMYDWIWINTSNGKGFEIHRDEFIEQLELVTNLNGLGFGINLIKYSFYGAYIIFEVNYLDDSIITDFDIWPLHDRLLNTATSEQELQELIYNNIYLYNHEYQVELSDKKKNELLNQYEMIIERTPYNGHSDIYNTYVTFKNEYREYNCNFMLYDESASNVIYNININGEYNWINLPYITEDGYQSEIGAHSIENDGNEPLENILNKLTYLSYYTLGGEENWYNSNEISEGMKKIDYTFTANEMIAGLYTMSFNDLHNTVYNFYIYDRKDADSIVSIQFDVNYDNEYNIRIDNMDVWAKSINVESSVDPLQAILNNLRYLSYNTLAGEYHETWDNYEAQNWMNNIGVEIINLPNIQGLYEVRFNSYIPRSYYFILADGNNNIVADVNVDFTNYYYTSVELGNGEWVDAIVFNEKDGDLTFEELLSSYVDNIGYTDINWNGYYCKEYVEKVNAFNAIGYSFDLNNGVYTLSFKNLNSTTYYFVIQA